MLRVAALLITLSTVAAWATSGDAGGRAAAGRSTSPEPSPTLAAAPAPAASTLPVVDAAPPSPDAVRAVPPADALRIAIPALGIDLPLAYGDVVRDVPRDGYPGGTPEHVALIFPGSAALASGGNTYIYAHARAGMFLSLWSVRLRETVIVYGPDVRLAYTVVRVAPRVPPTETSWLDPSGPERLTLQTSTGPGPGDPRFIVVAVRDQAP